MKKACDSNGIHKGAAKWLFLDFIKEYASAALSPGSEDATFDRMKKGNWRCTVNLLTNYWKFPQATTSSTKLKLLLWALNNYPGWESFVSPKLFGEKDLDMAVCTTSPD